MRNIDQIAAFSRSLTASARAILMGGLILLPFLECRTASAQWNLVVPASIPVPENGAISYKDGIIWCGDVELFRSSDRGLTWTTIPFKFDVASDKITDIDFFDKNNGLVTTFFSSFLTKDGGLTWKDLLSNQVNNCASGRFLGSPNAFAVAEFAPGEVLFSSDGGNNWTIDSVAPYIQQLAERPDGLYALTAATSDAQGDGGVLIRTQDFGKTWQTLPGIFDADSYCISFDSCQNRMFITNEGFFNSFDTTSEIVSSTDNGASWQLSASGDLPFFAGSVATGNHCDFASTSTGGVFRLMNDTWSSIGGPNCGIDMRSICAIDDSLIIVLDGSGSIWRTANSGGIPIVDTSERPYISASSLFVDDILPACKNGTSSIDLIPKSGYICTPPKIVSQQITGQDSNFYHLLHTAAGDITSIDSDVVLFTPAEPRNYSAVLEISFDNGQVLDVKLGGHSNDSEIIALSSPAIVTDTIGDLVVPLMTNTSITSAFDLTISYDTSILVYRGSFSVSGAKLDIDNSSPGIARIRIPAQSGVLSTDSIAALIHFEFYPTTHNCASVSFGSARFVDTDFCGAVIGTTMQICGINSCAQPILSGEMRYGTIPTFIITPNPSTGIAEITSSTALQSATIEVLNALGKIELTTIADIGATPFPLDMNSLSSGMKFVRILCGSEARMAAVLLMR